MSDEAKSDVLFMRGTSVGKTTELPTMLLDARTGRPLAPGNRHERRAHNKRLRKVLRRNEQRCNWGCGETFAAPVTLKS